MEFVGKEVDPTQSELQQFNLDDERTLALIRQAQEGDAADRLLGFREAVGKYRAAILWSILLSTSLVMEGYDLVIVRAHCRRCFGSMVLPNFVP